MGATGYEIKMYADITRIANALERIATAMERESNDEADATEHQATRQ